MAVFRAKTGGADLKYMPVQAGSFSPGDGHADRGVGTLASGIVVGSRQADRWAIRQDKVSLIVQDPT